MILPRTEDIQTDKDYFIFSTKWTNPGRGQKKLNYDKYVKIWWGPNNSGYTYDINDAGRYTGLQILQSFNYYCQDGETYPILCDEVLAGKYGKVMTSIFN